MIDYNVLIYILFYCVYLTMQHSKCFNSRISKRRLSDLLFSKRFIIYNNCTDSLKSYVQYYYAILMYNAHRRLFSLRVQNVKNVYPQTK